MPSALPVAYYASIALLANLVTFSATDVALMVGGALIAVSAWRNRQGKLYKDLRDEEHDAREALEIKYHAKIDECHELEKTIAALKSRPDIDKVFDLLVRHDESEREVWKNIADNQQTTSLILGGISKVLEDLDLHIHPERRTDARTE